MISCQAFRANLRPGSNDPEILEHLRKCDGCLDYAVSIDPGMLFRTLGGQEIVPPGGVDAFTADVMAQLRVRQAEGSVAARRFLIPTRRLAAAAAITATIGIAALVYDRAQKPVTHAATVAKVVRPAQLTTKPVVETYQAKNATIVEMPADGANVVMIFDDSLPADL
jgi:hypothetical protein